MNRNRNGVINSNISNFCSPDKFAKAYINRINPDKFTFLNSNLIVSNILNHLSPNQDPEINTTTDAYVLYSFTEADGKEELKKKAIADRQNKNKIARVHTLAKCRSQTTLDEMQRHENEIRQQVDQISVMRLEMGDKARDIMSRKEDTAYLGRNIFLEGQKYLKQMKGISPAEKQNKVEATRLLMKEKAKTTNRNNLMRLKQNNEDLSELSQNNQMNHMNNSFNSSTMEASIDTYGKRNSSQAKEQARDQHIAKLIRNGSYESVLTVQKRHAAWDGFTEHWAQGFKKNDDLIITKKKKRTKKSPKPKFIDVEENSQLEYHDKMSRHVALKKYKQTFDKTAASFQLVSN